MGKIESYKVKKSSSWQQGEKEPRAFRRPGSLGGRKTLFQQQKVLYSTCLTNASGAAVVLRVLESSADCDVQEEPTGPVPRCWGPPLGTGLTAEARQQLLLALGPIWLLVLEVAPPLGLRLPLLLV